MQRLTSNEVRDSVRKAYGEIARSEKVDCGCSPSSCCANTEVRSSEISLVLGYSEEDVESGLQGANLGLGCGNPQVIAELKSGETVLDLGSGGGFDCFLAARAVGNNGQVIGVDMTPDMIIRARNNAEKTGFANVEFRLGEIENLPVADNSIDVIISNCVINLSPEKARVFGESYRVLKAGGRLAISDIVATAELPANIRDNMELYSACVSGASTTEEIKMMLENAGFRDISVSPKDESRDFISKWSPGMKVEDFIVSANIQAVK